MNVFNRFDEATKQADPDQESHSKSVFKQDGLIGERRVIDAVDDDYFEGGPRHNSNRDHRNRSSGACPTVSAFIVVLLHGQKLEHGKVAHKAQGGDEGSKQPIFQRSK